VQVRAYLRSTTLRWPNEQGPAGNPSRQWTGGAQGPKLRLRFSSRKKIVVILDVSEGCRKGFLNTNKKQITEPVRKLRDESNDTN
jgi:hypothetical protein